MDWASLWSTKCVFIHPLAPEETISRRQDSILRASQRARVSKPQTFIRTHSAKSPVQKKLPWFWRTWELGAHAAKMYLAIFLSFPFDCFQSPDDPQQVSPIQEWHILKQGLSIYASRTFWDLRVYKMLNPCWLCHSGSSVSLHNFFLTNFALKWTSF